MIIIVLSRVYLIMFVIGWAGNAGGVECACGSTDRCDEDPQLACNCDNNDSKQRNDTGVWIDKDVLPVTKVHVQNIIGLPSFPFNVIVFKIYCVLSLQVCLGYATIKKRRMAYYNLGPLECAPSQFGKTIMPYHYTFPFYLMF